MLKKDERKKNPERYAEDTKTDKSNNRKNMIQKIIKIRIYHENSKV